MPNSDRSAVLLALCTVSWLACGVVPNPGDSSSFDSAPPCTTSEPSPSRSCWVATYATHDSPCATNPCLNGGVCSEALGDFSCACPPGFAGATCATMVHACAPNPCANGGSCTETGATHTCACNGDYSGPTCQVRWLTPALLETNDPDAHTPQVGVDGDGNAIATWTQADGPFVRVWTSRFVVGTGWSPATRIDSSDAGNALLPKVAVSAAGTAFVVWTQSEGTSSGIWANRFTIGAGWGTATPIGSSVGFVALSPQVAIDDAGNALAAWSESDGTRLNIRANRFVVGSGWGTAGLIESNDSGSASYPQVKMDGAGNAFAVWQQGDGARTDIRANRFVAGTGWGTATLIEHDDTGSASSPKLAVDKLGNAMVVWHQSDGTRFNIRANRFVVGAGWGTETLIESDNTGDAYSPAIAVDLAGNATVVWHQSDGTRVNIRANRFVVGTGWGSETFIESDDAGDAYSPRVEAARDGAVIAVWSQSDGTRSNIYANRFVVGSGWSTAKLIEANDSGDASAPEIAIDGSGNAVAVWEQGDGARSNVWASVRR